MDIVEITANGKMTFPAWVRESLGISDEGYLVAEKVGAFVVLRKLESPAERVAAERELAPSASD